MSIAAVTRLRNRIRTATAAARDKITDLRRRYEWCEFGFSALEHDRATGGALLAGALAFRLFLWLLPAMLVVVGGLGFTVPDDARRGASESGLGAFTADTIRTAAAEAHRARWVVLIGGLVLLYSASATLARAVVAATALEWQLPIPSLRISRAAASVVGLLGIALAVVFVANWLRHVSPLGITATIILALVWVSLAWVLSWFLPHPAGVSRLALLPGAILVGVGIQVLHLVTIFYLAPKVASASKLYGALGGAATLLLWTYLVARLLVGSATVNRTFMLHLERRRAAASSVPEG